MENPRPKWLGWKDARDAVDRIKATFVHVTLRPTKRKLLPLGHQRSKVISLSHL